MTNLPVLIIDDEPSLRTLLAKLLTLEGFTVFEAENAAKGRKTLEEELIYVVVSDVRLPDADGVELVSQLKEQYPDIEIVVITAFGTIEGGVTAIKHGAFDYITKGEEDDRVVLTVQKAAERASLRKQLRELQQRIDSKVEFSKLIGSSEAIARAIELAKKVATTDTTVLLLGETGTGKELFAEAIHRSSKRRNGPFVAINCSAIPKDIQESELFGHAKGAFTGAVTDKRGFFEEANAGTIFLDEIGDMTPETQTKLLRTFESRSITRLGETKPRPIDVRIIAATNVNLREAVGEKLFREDLYYRLNGFTIFLPPLRERLDDIDLLAYHFLRSFASEFGKDISGMSSGFVTALKRHRWLGNIRELKNVIERAVILSTGNTLTEDLLPEDVRSARNSDASAAHDVIPTLDELERKHITDILRKCSNNKTQAATLLGISVATLYRKLKEYGL
ncbi:MAG: sigma-54-dependent Fis family transcriptional regulator [Bacteroidetes bacterium]|nr:sigma-54-dependent Fis family transcriptional regulator [Bacteroidota bacterium]